MSNSGWKSLQFTVHYASAATCCCLLSLQSRQVGGKREREREFGGKRQKNESKGDRNQEETDHHSNVFLRPSPPCFPSDLHGHLSALAGTTSMFPLARLVVHQRVYLFACLPSSTCSQHLPCPPPVFLVLHLFACVVGKT